MLDLRTPHDYIAAIKRRRFSLAMPLLAGAVLSGIVAVIWPPSYKSVATILIEEPDVPRDLISSTVTSYADERIQVISQRVMTTPNLIDLIDKFSLYEKEREYEPISIIVDDMREDVSLQLVSADARNPRSGRAETATIAFSLSFEHRNAGTAQKVLNELVTLYLAENKRSRREKAAETTEFLTGEADRYRQTLDEIEANIAEFKKLHAGNLPAQFTAKMQMKTRLESNLSDNRRRVQDIEERKIYLQAQLSQIDPELPPQTGAGATTIDRLKALRIQFVTLSSKYGSSHPDVRKLAREIEALEQEVGPAGRRAVLEEQQRAYQEELAALRRKYSEKHPDVAKLRRQLEEVEAQLKTMPSNGVATTSKTVKNPTYLQFKAQLNALDTEMQTLLEQREELTATINRYEEELLAAPEIEREYTGMIREYERQLANYKAVKGKLTAAELGESLEAESKAEQFSLIEPPTRPVEPVKPNRPAILALGIALSLSIGAGLVALREVLDTAVYGPLQLASVSGVPPLVVIPRIETPGEKRRNWALKGAIVTGVALGLGLLVIGVHFLYLPLDVIWSILERKLELFLGVTFGA